MPKPKSKFSTTLNFKTQEEFLEFTARMQHQEMIDLCLGFVTFISDLPHEGERDESGEPYKPTGKGAIKAVNDLIFRARVLTDKEKACHRFLLKCEKCRIPKPTTRKRQKK